MTRFNRQYVAYFEGLQEKLYFNYIAELIKKEYPNIQIKFNSIKNLPALSRNSTIMKKIAIYDYDMNEVEFRKRANINKNIEIYYSNVCFDLWLLLHKTMYEKVVNSPSDYENDIKKFYALNNNVNIKQERIINKILEQISLDEVKNAIKNSKNIINRKLNNDFIKINNKFGYYDNPATNLYEFFDSLFSEINKEIGIVI